MLQQEGLITAERNQRARVAAMDPEVLESVYAQRILLSSLGIAVTVNRLSAHELGELDRLLGNMREAGELDELEAWERAHRAFHRGLVEHCGERLLRLKGLVDVAEMPGRPALIHGVRHVFAAPEWLDRWPSDDRRTRIVFIGEAIPRHFPARLLGAIEAEVIDETRRQTWN